MPMHLNLYLTEKLGRTIRAKDVAGALGISSSTHATRTTTGFSADEVIQVARHFRLDAADVLVDLGYIDPPPSPRLDTATDTELAEELMRRATDPHPPTPGVQNAGTDVARDYRKQVQRLRERERWSEQLGM